MDSESKSEVVSSNSRNSHNILIPKPSNDVYMHKSTKFQIFKISKMKKFTFFKLDVL